MFLAVVLNYQLHNMFCIQARKVEVKQVDFNASFITRMIPKIDWSALKTAAETVRNI